MFEVSWYAFYESLPDNQKKRLSTNCIHSYVILYFYISICNQSGLLLLPYQSPPLVSMPTPACTCNYKGTIQYMSRFGKVERNDSHHRNKDWLILLEKLSDKFDFSVEIKTLRFSGTVSHSKVAKYSWLDKLPSCSKIVEEPVANKNIKNEKSSFGRQSILIDFCNKVRITIFSTHDFDWAGCFLNYLFDHLTSCWFVYLIC